MSFFDRLKEARLIRVLAVYLGASWMVVEAADLLQEQLSLPSWVVPVTLILLLVGLVVVAATALVQASPATDRREAAGEVPTDWELDLPDLTRSILGGRLPHLTWGRAIAGGVVAFLALFGLASLLVRGGEELAPRELAADPAAPGLAVLPFRVSGDDLTAWREGMVDLLSRNMDGVGGLRAIDSRTVLARWSEVVGDDVAPDLAGALDVADRTGAHWALVGSAVEVGPRVRLSADIYDVATGQRLDGATVEGVPDSLFSLVDALSVDVARTLLQREDPDLSALRLSSITTSSPEALRRFLEGEAAYRRMRFAEAAEVLGRAIELDPGFALAHYRLASARGWMGGGGSGEREAAYEHRDRLPEREALMVEAEYRARSGALPSGVALLREGVQRYPDDPEMWYQLGDIYIHWGAQLLMSPEDAERALSRAVELDPGFAPYQIHLVDLALVRGDSAEAARRLEREASLAGPDSREVRAQRLQFDYAYGSDEDRERVLAALDTLGADVRLWFRFPFSLDGDKAPAMLELANAACGPTIDAPATSAAAQYGCVYTHLANGRIDDAERLDRLIRRGGMHAIPATAEIVMRQTGMDPSIALEDPDSVLPSATAPGVRLQPGLVIVGILAVERGRTAMVDSILGVFDDDATALTARGDTLHARLVHGLSRGLLGYRALAAGRPDSALRRLEDATDLLAGGTGPQDAVRNLLVWPLAGLYADAGRERAALELYAALWQSLYAGPALLRRAEIHDRLGEPELADRLRARFLAMWSGADPDHPLVQEARQGLPPG